MVGEKREWVEGRAAGDGPQCSVMECEGHSGKEGRREGKRKRREGRRKEGREEEKKAGRKVERRKKKERRKEGNMKERKKEDLGCLLCLSLFWEGD